MKPLIVDDRTPEQVTVYRWAVVCKDEAMSNRGRARGGTYRVAWACSSHSDAMRVFDWVQSRKEMVQIQLVNLLTYKPYTTDKVFHIVVEEDYQRRKQEIADEAARQVEQDNEARLLSSAIVIAQNATCFDKASKQPIQAAEFAKLQTCSAGVANESFTKYLVRNFAGDYTDYGWHAKRIDSQTFCVICGVTLDGNKYDFIFKVNTELETCRYEGGTALAKLDSRQFSGRGDWRHVRR